MEKGTTISHYRIVEHLGGGGMGVVYRAEDTKLGREVALKFLPPEWSRDPAARERFLREARAASALEDSRICTVHDIDETDDGRLFIVMAFYEGETLKKRIERGRLPIGTAIDIAIQVAEGLERAHAAEIVHRDIKPANLMLTRRDEVVIVDFGLAKLAGELSLTKSGSSLGTPHYMSPEQARGERVDRRTDLWSLGVVLFEMLTGQRPFGGDNNAAIARAILDDEPQPLSGLRPETPSELGAIVAKALEKDASRRYQSAGEFLGDLRELQNQISDREGVTEAAPSRVPVRRRLYLAPVLIATVLFAATAGVVWFLRSDVLMEPADEAPPRIVVLPFENLGPAKDEYFADGMTEEIISRLAAVSGLQVISRTSAMQYKDTDKAIRQIGEELDVQYALEGTVRWERAGEGHGRVRITPQLIKVADDSHLWSDRYDRAIESVFEVQSDIAQQVVEQLHVTLLEPEEEFLSARPTDNPEAYEAYLRGLHYSVDTNDLEDVKLAVAMFERAVELDPNFAVAWANLSKQLSWLYFVFDASPERREASRRAAERALEIDPTLPEGHSALGIYYYQCLRDYERALEELNQASKSRPNDTSAMAYRAYVFRRQGRWQEAIEMLNSAFALDPKDAEIAQELSGIYHATRDFHRAERLIDLSISLAPDDATGYFFKSVQLFSTGRYHDARLALENAPVQTPILEQFIVEFDLAERRFESALARTLETPVSVYTRAWGQRGAGLHAIDMCRCYHFLGDRQGVQTWCGRARDWFEEMVRQDPQFYETTFGGLATAYAYLGLKDEAIREGQRGVALLPITEDANDGPSRVQILARIYATVNEPDAAIALLDSLLSIPGRLTVGYLRSHPDWDPLRDHPRFQALLEKYEVEQ